MRSRTNVACAVLVGLSVAACANDRPEVSSLSAGSMTLAAAPMKVEAEPLTAPHEMPRKTMSDRVLAAIALERVTGLKPDPARLLQ